MGVSGNDYRVRAPGSIQELAGAEQLISDLAALLDAGLVVAHEHILGPPRYGVAPGADHHNGRLRADPGPGQILRRPSSHFPHLRLTQK